MKTACQQCADLTRQLQDAAKEELQLYNNYFVDILFRSMQPRQQVCSMTTRVPCELNGSVAHSEIGLTQRASAGGQPWGGKFTFDSAEQTLLIRTL